MFQKIANVLSIISFVMVASMSGGAYFGYKYVTSEQFKSRVMNEILGNVQGMMPKVLEKELHLGQDKLVTILYSPDIIG